MNLINEIKTIVSKVFIELGYDENLATIVLSNRPDLCQFTCNGAMSGAKIYKTNPMAIATKVSEKLISMDVFKEITVASPGFINITLTNEYLENHINKYNSLKDIVDKFEPEKIIIDYGGPNVAKPLHVGHMRTANIGESIKRIGLFLGHDIIGDIHIGDWGLQMGLVITEIKSRFPDLYYFKEDYIPSENDTCPVTINQLNEIYPTASQKSKDDEEYKNLAYDATRRLQNHEKGYYDLWKQLVKETIKNVKSVYDRMNVHFDLWYGESDANFYVSELLEILDKKNLSYISDGALVVDVSEENDKIEMPPIIIKKSDGSLLYGTSDLATIIQRKKDFDPKQILYVVDSRQSLHFTQVFRCAKKADLICEDVNLEFVGFGTFNGKDGKPFRTRDGGIMPLEDLINAMTKGAFDKISENMSDEVDIQTKNIIAEKIGIAALKFGDLSTQRSKDYIFDTDRFLSFEGKTGPYLLYNVTRINSILRRIPDFPKGKIKLYSNTEIEIVLTILMTEDILVKAFSEKMPHYLCEHAYNLASLFSKFYNENIIISETNIEKRNSWLNLLLVIKDALINILDLLGIESVEKM